MLIVEDVLAAHSTTHALAWLGFGMMMLCSSFMLET
jgi:hypothetical protein